MQLEVLSVHSKEANVLSAVRACKKYKKQLRSYRILFVDLRTTV